MSHIVVLRLSVFCSRDINLHFSEKPTHLNHTKQKKHNPLIFYQQLCFFIIDHFADVSNMVDHYAGVSKMIRYVLNF